MDRKTLWNRVLILLPALLGILGAGALGLAFPRYPVLHLSIDLGSLLIVVGILVSVLLIVVRLGNNRYEKEAQKLISDIQDENKQFLLRLDHELKNPISTIRTGVAHLEQVFISEGDTGIGAPAEEIRQTVSRISSQSMRLNQLISDLRKLAEMETCLLDWTFVDIHSLLEHVVKAARSEPAGKEKNITLSLPGAPWNLPEIRADEDLLYICLRNVLDNAVKYTEPGDSIVIRAFESMKTVQIEIADSGIGIPAEDLAKVWGKLYRAQNARGYPGNGLGLSMVQAIIMRLGGDCDLRSRDGEGTVLTIILPRSAEE